MEQQQSFVWIKTLVFNSYTFIVFFLVVVAVYYAFENWTFRKLWLLASSLVFYAAWNPPFVLLLVFSTLVDWYLAKAIFSASSSGYKKVWLVLSLTTNLGILFYFKYSQLILDSFASLLSSFGIAYQSPNLDIILPVGISFYTFQTLSYTLDVYRGKEAPANSFVDYALYVTFFPQLVAGPIVRSTDFLPQCEVAKSWKSTDFLYGLLLMLLGMFQKIVVADGLAAPIVEKVYDEMRDPNTISAWVGTLAFAVQIFSDFAGYSTCAIGCAICLGFSLARNFHAPYAAVGFSDFWQRWHISLSSWLRDYLYIPLGGNRKGNVRTYANLLVTMLIGGLWHGASWTFVAWGGFHGVLLIVERMVRRRFGEQLHQPGPILNVVAIGTTFLLICFSWVLFRSPDFKFAYTMFNAMLWYSPNGQSIDAKSVAISVALMVSVLLIHYVFRDNPLDERLSRFPVWLIGVVAGIMLYLCLTIGGTDRAFIYFQF